jgi:uncharacterized protein YgiM (DUF1202 family)
MLKKTLLFVCLFSLLNFGQFAMAEEIVTTRFPVQLLVEPTFTSSTMEKLEANVPLRVLTYTGEWVQVEHGDSIGYVALKWVTGVTPPPPEERQAVSVNTPKPDHTSEVKTLSTKTEFMPTPTFQSMPLAMLPKGTMLPVFGKSGRWYKVKFDGQEGYVEERFVTPELTADARMRAIADLLAKAKKIPISKYQLNKAIYSELQKLDPQNSAYKEKYEYYSSVLEKQIAEQEAQARIGKVLEITSWNWRQESGYAVVEGMVKNLTQTKLENVQAVAAFFTSEGDLITYGSTLIKYRPLMPGQTSPFRVMAVWNPMMKTTSLTFTTRSGKKLPAYQAPR